MGRVRQFLAAGLILILLCGLAACGEDDSDQNQDWVWASSYSSFGAISNSGYYYTAEGGFLQYADLAVGESVTLCSRVSCKHEDETCEAFIPFKTLMFFWNDCLYYIENNTLYLRDSVGMNLRKVCDLGEKYTKEQKDFSIFYYAVTDGFLYYSARISGVVDHVVQREMDCVGRIELSTGAEDILLEQKVDAILDELRLCAAQKDAVLLCTREGTALESDDPNYDEAMNQMPVVLKRYDVKTQESSTLFQKTYQECSSIMAVAGGELYYKARSNSQSDNAGFSYAYSLETGAEEFVCGEGFWYLGEKYALKADGQTDEWHIFDLQLREKLPCEIQDLMPVQNMSSSGVVLYRMIRENEVDNTGRIKAREYNYIPYAVLADGLQEADLIPLYTLKMGYS